MECVFFITCLCVLYSYNQQEEDFSSLHEYNDYLEEVETIGVGAPHHILLLSLTTICVQCSTCVMVWMWRQLRKR